MTTLSHKHRWNFITNHLPKTIEYGRGGVLHWKEWHRADKTSRHPLQLKSAIIRKSPINLTAVLPVEMGCCRNISYHNVLLLKRCCTHNHLEGLFKHQLLGSTPRVQIQECEFLTNSQVTMMMLVQMTL